MKLQRLGLGVALRWGMLFLILLLIVNYAVSNKNEFAALLDISWIKLVPVVLLTFGLLLLAALRYALVIEAVTGNASYGSAIKQVVVSRFLNRFIPQSGLAYKVHTLKVEQGLRYEQIVQGLFTFVWLDLVATVLTATSVSLSSHIRLNVLDIHISLPLASISIILLLFTFYGHKLFNSEAIAAHQNSLPSGVLGKLSSKLHAALVLLRNKKLLISGVTLVVMSIILSIYRLSLCFSVFDLEVSIPSLTIFVVMNRLLTMVVITPGNIGIMEGTFGLIAEEIGMGAASGILVAFTLRASSFFVLAAMSATVLLIDVLLRRNSKIN